MRLPQLTEIPTSRDIIDSFKGYRHKLQVDGDEFYDEKNITSDYYPVLSPRRPRGTFAYPSQGTHKPNGMIAKDSFCYVDGTTLYIGSTAVQDFVLTDTPKQLVSMGAYLIIMPDKKYINTIDTSDKGNIEASYTSLGTVSYELCNVDGEAYSDVTVSDEEPSSPENLDYWLDTSQTPHVLKQYSSSSKMWTQVATTYIKIKASGIGASFSAYDGVRITGISSELTQLQDINDKTSVLYQVHHDSETPSNDYIVVIGVLDTASTQEDPITVSRKMPNTDFLIESENRLWGCRYGTNVDGETVNEIYACKQGDFKNWNCFMNISTDSYYASCGTDGAFTGAITHLGYPLFFKESCLHKVYGSMPSNYQIQTTSCRGVQKGAGRSLAIVNEVLYYKSRNGICSYDGSLPQDSSDALGEVHYTGVDNSVGTDSLRNGACAGAFNSKYYISMKSEVDNLWHLFVLDTQKGLWHREDNTQVKEFCCYKDHLYYIQEGSTSIKETVGTDSEEVDWMCESGILAYPLVKYGSGKMSDKKYISSIVLRMSLALGSRVYVYAQYDSDGEWEHMMTMSGTSLRAFSIPVRPRRCDHFRLRIVGQGDAKLYSIAKTFEEGSDR